ncbi:type I restriction endonuclease subunit R [Aquimarina muelleri]|uniref:type I restriction endonuclease subunit R n=1 Tax=Aquimarina muelleri TaxID=279356 RepID=UPI003F686B4E
MNESQTRKTLIDNKLQNAGWNVDDVTQVIEELLVEVQSVNEPDEKYGNQFSDYVLLGKDGSPIAVIEAKKSSVDARKGEEQAKQYAHHIQIKFDCDLPFCFYTNGHDIYFWDIGNAPPRKVYGFPTRSDLERLSHIRKHKKPLAEELINTEIAGRAYQIGAIRSVFESLENKKRTSLLVMATGTGKTRTCIAMVDALMRAGWVSRILFLVDRIVLRNQAIEAFREHTPQLSVWPKEEEKDLALDRRVYVSTYPTMLNIIDEGHDKLSPHFFDMVIIDESHRSIYNVYQNVLDYFNTITLGLTATPTDVIDHNTFQLFDCEDGLPTFAYTYEEAVKNIPPYLNNFEVLKIGTKFQEEGIHLNTISIEDQKKMIAEGKDPKEINFEGSQLEKTVSNKGTNALIVREFMEECIKVPNGVLPGKTIFFCTGKRHARALKDVFNQYYPQYNGELAKVIVSDDPRVYGKGGLLDQFKNNDFPRIALSVDMLDTGIDVRELVNLVFAKPVFSYTKFWQMIGRGTRLLDGNNLKPWCHKKDKFLIIDCWDNFEYFKLNPEGRKNKSQLALPIQLFSLRLEKLKLLLENNVKYVHKEIKTIRGFIAQLPPKNVIVVEHKNSLVKVETDEFWEHLDTTRLEYLEIVIAPIMRAISGLDFKAMRFEKDLVEASVLKLQDERVNYENLVELITSQLAELPLTIREVEKEKQLIQNASKTSFWASYSEEKEDELILKIAPLIRYRQAFSDGNDFTFLNLRDVTYTKKLIEFGPENEQVSISRYREMVEETVLGMARQDLTLQKLKSGEELTTEEIKKLAQLLNEKDPFVTEQLLRRVYDNKQAKFIQFIKHILGIEHIQSYEKTVSNLFEAFIMEHNNLTSKQIRFLEILKNYALDKGTVTKKDLINPPFTQLHNNGILGVFSPDLINEIIALTERVSA